MGAKYGQHFLKSTRKLLWIVRQISPAASDNIIEIGCGHGELTGFLVKRCGAFWGVELDSRLFNTLQERFSSLHNAHLVNADFLNWNGPDSGENFRLVGNLPYYQATAIIDRVVDGELRWRDAHFLVQKEVAERICARPGRRQRGWFSIWIQTFAYAEILGFIGPRFFFPPPKVDSALVRLTRVENPTICNSEKEPFQGFLHSCFAQKRKTLLNNLEHKFGERFSKAEIKELMGKLSINEMARAEAVELESLIGLFHSLVELEVLQ
jgi:16S rRNA (adenine1518-N6/adenine1519-N6)-dimethyltransferase